MKRINFIAIIISLFASCTTLQKVNNETIDSLDLNRFLGEWYEIARFDHCFESGMENNNAVYTMGEDGIVSVKNSGVKNGNLKEVSGIAKTTDNPGLLRVSFFKPFYADYRVLYLDAHYQYAYYSFKNFTKKSFIPSMYVPFGRKSTSISFPYSPKIQFPSIS